MDSNGVVESEARLVSRRMRDGAEHIARGVADICQETGDLRAAAVARAIADGIASLPLFGDEPGSVRAMVRGETNAAS